MDPHVSGSFIPKAPLVESRRHTPGMGLLLLLSIVLFIFSLLAAAGVFAYQGILTSAIASQDQQLTRAEGAFEPDVINDLSRLDSRLNKTKDLLANHLAPSGIFDFLSTVTLTNVQFTKFSYHIGAAGTASIALSGIADSFSTVALQSDQFGSARLFKNVVFSGVSVGQGGKVTFDVSAELDQSLFKYAKQSQDAVVPVTSGSQTVPTTPTNTGSTTQQQ